MNESKYVLIDNVYIHITLILLNSTCVCQNYGSKGNIVLAPQNVYIYTFTIKVEPVGDCSVASNSLFFLGYINLRSWQTFKWDLKYFTCLGKKYNAGLGNYPFMIGTMYM